MIPLNAAEAADLLRIREREVATRRRMVKHFGILQENERQRLARVEAEVAALRSWPPPPLASLSRTEAGR